MCVLSEPHWSSFSHSFLADDTIPDTGGGMRGWDNDDAPAARGRAGQQTTQCHAAHKECGNFGIREASSFEWEVASQRIEKLRR